MTEMELFVDLIDGVEADNILKYFKENPNGTRREAATLQQKKIQIKRVFKSMTPNMKRKRKRGGANPFYVYINKFSSITSEKGDDFYSHILVLNKMYEKTPNYAKFSNLLLNFPEETRQKLEEFDLVIKNGGNFLDINTDFNSIDELKAFLIRFSDYMGDNAPKVISRKIMKETLSFNSSKLKDCEVVVKHQNLLEFYNEKDTLYSEYSVPITNIAYINTHANEDKDILMLLAIEAMYESMISQNNNIENKVNEAIKTIEDEHLIIQNKVKDKENEITALKSELNKISKNNKALKMELQSLKKTFEVRAEEFHKVNIDNEKEYQQQIEKLNRIKEEYENQIKKLNNQIEMNRVINEERDNLLNVATAVGIDWGIVCISGFEIIKEIYPEIPIIDVEKDAKSILKGESINTIYLIMNGLSTKKYRRIKREIEKNDIEVEALEFENVKEAIEWIGYKKTIEKRGVTV